MGSVQAAAWLHRLQCTSRARWRTDGQRRGGGARAATHTEHLQVLKPRRLARGRQLLRAHEWWEQAVASC